MVKGVRNTSEEYDEMLPTWKRCRDVILGGTRKLREEREAYLPRYFEEEDDSYNARLNRTPLFNASYRTAAGYRGLLFRKPAVVVVPPNVEPMLEDITLSGVSLNILALELTEECLVTGRCGLWVNYPDASTVPTKADALALNLRPSLHLCEAESITNWATRRVDNRTVLSLVVIAEERCTQVDEFTVEEEDVFRVLDLVDVPILGTNVPKTVYRVRLMRYDKENDVDVTLEENIPLMGGEPLGEIPFFFISPDDVEPDVDEPPLVDLVDLNLTHFEQMSSYLHGCFWSGIPQPYISGVELKPGEKLRIGGSCWVFPAVSAKADMLEVGAQGFVALEKVLTRLENEMIVVGSRALELQHPGGTEGVSTAMVHLAGEHSVLSAIGQSISIGFTNALKAFVRWTGADATDTKYVLNNDFFNTPMTPEERLSIVKSWQSKAISDEAKFSLLQQKGDYPADATFAGEQAKANTAPDTTKPIPDQPLADQTNATVAIAT